MALCGVGIAYRAQIGPFWSTDGRLWFLDDRDEVLETDEVVLREGLPGRAVRPHPRPDAVVGRWPDTFVSKAVAGTGGVPRDPRAARARREPDGPLEHRRPDGKAAREAGSDKRGRPPHDVPLSRPLIEEGQFSEKSDQPDTNIGLIKRRINPGQHK